MTVAVTGSVRLGRLLNGLRDVFDIAGIHNEVLVIPASFAMEVVSPVTEEGAAFVAAAREAQG